MELETEDKININFNGFFYPTVCHVCKRFGDDVPLRICSGCKMISYCGKKHQEQHWPQHQTLCSTMQNVLMDGLEDTTPDDRLEQKLRLLEMVKTKMRFLEFYENQMLEFPRECAICLEQNVELLVDCRNCLVSFCKDHKDNIVHTDACESLKLFFHINLSAVTKNRGINLNSFCNGYTYVEYCSTTNTKTSNTFRDMKSFIRAYWNKEETEDAHSETILAANRSEFVTRPLTLFYAMQVLNYVPERKELVIHVVAAGNMENFTLSMWEIFLHLVKTDIVSLMIIMIGKDLIAKSRALSICDKCLAQGKKMSVKFHTVLYQKYVLSPLFVKPDLIVGFNVNIPGNEMTELSIKALAKQNCPFVITCKEQEELEKYSNNINTILDRTVDCLYSEKNPFASLRPSRGQNCVEPKLISYNNHFLVIYRSLCS